jgi:hypothetical protein
MRNGLLVQYVRSSYSGLRIEEQQTEEYSKDLYLPEKWAWKYPECSSVEPC